MKEYELLYEYYDTCSPRPTTSFSEVEADDLDTYMAQFLSGDITWKKSENADGDIVYELEEKGIRKRYIFTEI